MVNLALSVAQAKVCKRGHVLTPETTYKINDKQRGVRYRCKQCAARKPTGGQDVIAERIQRRAERVEDIEFLLTQGVKGEELLDRSGYTRMRNLRAALINEGRHDLIERL